MPLTDMRGEPLLYDAWYWARISSEKQRNNSFSGEAICGSWNGEQLRCGDYRIHHSFLADFVPVQLPNEYEQ